MPWGGFDALLKAERRSGYLNIHISSCVYISAIFDSFTHATILYILVKKKSGRLYFYTSALVLFFSVYKKTPQDFKG